MKLWPWLWNRARAGQRSLTRKAGVLSIAHQLAGGCRAGSVGCCAMPHEPFRARQVREDALPHPLRVHAGKHQEPS